MKADKKLSRRKLLGFYLLLLVFFIILQEAAFMLIFPVPEIVNFNRIEYSKTLREPGTQEQRYISNASFSYVSDPDGAEFVHSLNLYGFRDRDWKTARKDWQLRVAVVGDSFVEGFMASDDETITRAFEGRLHEEERDIEVLNLGVGGSDLPGHFILIRDLLPVFKPTHLVLLLYANDFISADYNPAWLSHGLVPEYSNKWTPRAYFVVRELLRGRPVPRSWRADPFPYRAAVPSPRNPLSNRKFAQYVEKIVSPEIATAMKKGRFSGYSVNEYQNYKSFIRKNIDLRPHLTALKNYTDSFSTELFIVYLPSRSQVSNEYLRFQRSFSRMDDPAPSLMGEEYQIQARIIKKAADLNGIPFLDLTPVLRKYEREGRRLYWNYDEHMRAEGYELIGRHIYDLLEGRL